MQVCFNYLYYIVDLFDETKKKSRTQMNAGPIMKRIKVSLRLLGKS